MQPHWLVIGIVIDKHLIKDQIDSCHLRLLNQHQKAYWLAMIQMTCWNPLSHVLCIPWTSFLQDCSFWNKKIVFSMPWLGATFYCSQQNKDSRHILVHNSTIHRITISFQPLKKLQVVQWSSFNKLVHLNILHGKTNH